MCHQRVAEVAEARQQSDWGGWYTGTLMPPHVQAAGSASICGSSSPQTQPLPLMLMPCRKQKHMKERANSLCQLLLQQRLLPQAIARSCGHARSCRCRAAGLSIRHHFCDAARLCSTRAGGGVALATACVRCPFGGTSAGTWQRRPACLGRSTAHSCCPAQRNHLAKVELFLWMPPGWSALGAGPPLWPARATAACTHTSSAQHPPKSDTPQIQMRPRYKPGSWVPPP